MKKQIIDGVPVLMNAGAGAVIINVNFQAGEGWPVNNAPAKVTTSEYVPH